MVWYKQMGKIPRKRHVVFRKEDHSLYNEQVMGTKGFSGIQSILYHENPPTQFFKSELLGKFSPEYEDKGVLRPRHFFTSEMHNEPSDAVMGREYILGNEDLLIGVVQPTEKMDYFYRNGNGDELLFVHHGSGTIESSFGTLTYNAGDYIVIPVGTIYRVNPDPGKSQFLVLETTSWVTTPKKYRNEFGQLLEHSPFCERDIQGPEELVTYTDKGEYEVRTKLGDYMHAHYYQHHPLDVVGWDGYLYPWKLNILDFEPITGRIHQPPPVHQTFEGNNFVVCSFVPRLYDYHPEAIPAPYFHSNVDSEEILYYVDGNFMSRKGITEGSLTFHPGGLPHGPHPGKIEESIGKKDTHELAVMIDTFRPLKVVKKAQKIEDQNYQYSWIKNK